MTDTEHDPHEEKATPGRTNSVERRNYEKLVELFPQVTSGEFTYQRSEAGGGFMPLSVEWIGTDRLSLMHTSTLNGDLIYEPMVVYQIDKEAKTATAIKYEQSLPPIYQYIDVHGIGYSIDGNGNERTIRNLQAQINDFSSQWFENIGNQGYMPVTAVLRDEERTDPKVYFNSDGKAFGMAFMYANDGTTVYNHMEESENGRMAEIAFVDSYRNVTFYEENLPKAITDYVPTVKLNNEKEQKNSEKTKPSLESALAAAEKKSKHGEMVRQYNTAEKSGRNNNGER